MIAGFNPDRADCRVLTWGFGLLGLGPNLTTAKTPQEIPQVLFGR